VGNPTVQVQEKESQRVHPQRLGAPRGPEFQPGPSLGPYISRASLDWSGTVQLFTLRSFLTSQIQERAGHMLGVTLTV
jgi:hypothetical protein